MSLIAFTAAFFNIKLVHVQKWYVKLIYRYLSHVNAIIVRCVTTRSHAPLSVSRTQT